MISSLIFPSIIYAQAPPHVNVLGWNDFIAPNTNSDFTKKTGIKVNYDITDSSDIMEAKLISGKSGYDVAIPSSNPSIPRLIQTNALLELDRSKIPNWQYLDPALMRIVEDVDPGNKYAIIYQYVVIGLGVNIDKVKELAPDAPLDSLDLIFNPKYASRLATCGIVMLDSPLEIIETIINYYGFPRDTTDPEHLAMINEKLQEIRPYIRYFHSSSYISDLASGDVCVALGFSGDINQAATRAKEIGSGENISLFIPKEGSEISFDMLVIPEDADHKEEAYRYLNNMLDPKVMAEISDYIEYPNAIPASRQYMDPKIAQSDKVFLSEKTLKNTFTSGQFSKIDLRKRNRLWSKFVYNR
jgi:putrescine transport system substrate-binding protein